MQDLVHRLGLLESRMVEGLSAMPQEVQKQTSIREAVIHDVGELKTELAGLKSSQSTQNTSGKLESPGLDASSTESHSPVQTATYQTLSSDSSPAPRRPDFCVGSQPMSPESSEIPARIERLGKGVLQLLPL